MIFPIPGRFAEQTSTNAKKWAMVYLYHNRPGDDFRVA